MTVAVGLEQALADPGYTPGQGALPGLIAALPHAPKDQSAALERVICRAGDGAVAPALLAFGAAPAPARPALLSLFGRLAAATRDARLYPVLLAALGDAESLVRKRAARALGKLGDARAEAALLEALTAAPLPEQKSIVDALGNLGGRAARDALEALPATDPELERRRQRALVLLERRHGRSEAATLVFDRPFPAATRIACTCRSGLSALLAEQLNGVGTPRIVSPSRVELEHRGGLGDLLVARSALDFALLVPIESDAVEVHVRLAHALAQPATVARVRNITSGPLRFRVAWSDAAHHRGLTWQLAGALRELTREIENDSRAALWTARVPVTGRGEIELVPRLDPDPRFAYRQATVPAASHPTLAAALAQVAGARADDVVWDPFVGSGSELIERARLGPFAALHGSDLEERALHAAARNLRAAGITTAQLARAGALEHAPEGVSLIITNPPMGRRVARDGSIAALLEGFVAHAARVLRPGGRLVWLSPLAQRTERAARSAGLRSAGGPDVDMGGFSARLQVLVRPA